MNHQTKGFLVGKTTLMPLLADITTLQADALVQPSGTSPEQDLLVLQASPWVIKADTTGAIAEALAPHAPLQLGTVVVTTAGATKAKYLLHAVVIDWARQHPSKLLVVNEVITAMAKRCIEIATALQMRSIAFTAWGTRTAGGKANQITALMMQAIVAQLQEQPSSLETVYLVSNNHEHYQWFVDRAFVFHVLSEQVAQVRKEIRDLDIPQERRRQLLSLLDNLQNNVVVYNQIVNGDKIDVHSGNYQPGWRADTVNQGMGDIHSHTQVDREAS